MWWISMSICNPYVLNVNEVAKHIGNIRFHGTISLGFDSVARPELKLLTIKLFLNV